MYRSVVIIIMIIYSSATVQLDNVLVSWNFQRVPVAPDGNCLFYAVALNILQQISTGNHHLQSTLMGLGLSISELNNTKCIAKLIREAVVSEWTGINCEYYQRFVSVNIMSEAPRYLASGEFSGSLGDLVILAIANILRVPITIFSSIPNMPLLCITSSLHDAVSSVPLYLAYIHSGPGHYDYVVTSPTQTPKCRGHCTVCKV